MLTWTLDFTGTPSPRDIAGATHAIENENAHRAADLDDEGNPRLPPLPYATGAQLKASYLGVLTDRAARHHERTCQQAAEATATAEHLEQRWRAATPDVQAQILALLPPLS